MQFTLLLEQRLSDRKILQQEEQPFLEIISSTATRARNMINALLQLSRATTTKLNIEPIALDSLIEAITGELRSEYPQKEIVINLDALSQTINTDESSLKIAIKAIIDNNVRFCSDHEQIKISIQTTELEDRIDLTFKDSGKGIGLTTANRIALRHNGDLGLEPEADNAEYRWLQLSLALNTPSDETQDWAFRTLTML